MYTPSTSTADAIPSSAWWVVDLEGETLGRAATRIAHVLRGKHKPSFTPHIDDGDFVIVINADKVHLSGRKWEQKTYYRHTGYVGGIIETTAEEMRERHPDRIITKAVKGMLPRGPLGRAQLRKLKVYVGSDHPHTAQQPQKLNLETLLGRAQG
jgi:large subunit ribosomal protein L13